MVTYHEQSTITVKVYGRVAGQIKEKKGKGFYYRPKGASKRYVPEYHPSLNAVKLSLEQQ